MFSLIYFALWSALVISPSFPFFQLKSLEDHISSVYCLHSPFWHGVVWNRGIPGQINWQDTKARFRQDKLQSLVMRSSRYVVVNVLWQLHINLCHIACHISNTLCNVIHIISQSRGIWSMEYALVGVNSGICLVFIFIFFCQKQSSGVHS